jgi:outer membrane protein assembly factor BamD
MKYILILIFAWVLNGCAIFGAPTELDETKGWSAERIYEAGETSMRDKDYEKAIGYFEKLESRFPHGRFATQAQLEIAYAHYKRQEPILAVAAADRFIKIHFLRSKTWSPVIPTVVTPRMLHNGWFTFPIAWLSMNCM